MARTTVVAERIDNPVQGQFIGYLHLGSEIANRFAVNLAVPVLLLGNYGDDPTAAGVGTGGIGDTPTTLHDIRFDARVKTPRVRHAQAADRCRRRDFRRHR